MNKKTIILLVSLIAVVALFLILRRNNSSTLGGDDKAFEFKSTANIDKVFISNRATGQYVTLTKLDSNHWRLNDKYNVNLYQLEILFEGLRNIRVKRPVSKHEMTLVKKDLALRGSKVEIYEKGKLSKTYYIGNNAIAEMGTYFMMENGNEPYLCHIPGFNGYPGARYHSTIEAWRSKSIFNSKPEEIKTIQINWIDNPANSFTIDNSGQQPVLISGNKTFTNNSEANLNLIKTYLKFWELSYEGFPIDLTAHDIDSISKTKPFLKMELLRKDGTKTTLSIHRKGLKIDSPKQTDDEGNPLQFEMENYYAFIDGNTKEIVQIQDFVFGKVMKTTSDFLIKK